MVTAVDSVQVRHSLAGRTHREDFSLDGGHDSPVLLRHEGSDKLSSIETVLLHPLSNIRSRLLVLINREREVTSIHRGILNCLTFNVVSLFSLTDRWNINRVAIREVGEHTNV